MVIPFFYSIVFYSIFFCTKLFIQCWVTGSHDNTVRLWNPRGDHIMIIRVPGTVCVCCVPCAREQFVRAGGVTALSIDKNFGFLLFAATDHVIRVWNPVLDYQIQVHTHNSLTLPHKHLPFRNIRDTPTLLLALCTSPRRLSTFQHPGTLVFVCGLHQQQTTKNLFRFYPLQQSLHGK